jgi:hypothetical protein
LFDSQRKNGLWSSVLNTPQSRSSLILATYYEIPASFLAQAAKSASESKERSRSLVIPLLSVISAPVILPPLTIPVAW